MAETHGEQLSFASADEKPCDLRQGGPTASRNPRRRGLVGVHEAPKAQPPRAPSATREALADRPPGFVALPPETELWDIAHAAQFLKMSVSWVYKRVESGDLPCKRMHGWSLRFVPSDLRAWAEKQPSRRRSPRGTTGR